MSRRRQTSSTFRVDAAAATGLLVTAFAVTLCGYFFFPLHKSADPSGILLDSKGGAVIFAHRLHAGDEGAAIGCSDCHHNYIAADSSSPRQMNCRDCHYRDPEIAKAACADDETHPRCIGKQCVTCHEGESCNFCHRKRR